MTVLQFVPAAQWQPPPPAAVFGELSQDGSTVILIAQGDAWDMKTTGERLSALTPAVKIVDKGNDVLSVPCTWPAVIQLAHSFPGTYGSPRWVPGPRLCAWVVDELTRRTALPDRAAYPELPPGLELRPYQNAAAAAIAQLGRFLIFDEPGPQPVSTPIWTPDGWRTLGDLQPGDVVYDLNGKPAPVRAIKFQGHQPVYRITFNDRTSTLATGGHRWRVLTRKNRMADGPGQVLSTSQLRAKGLIYGNGESKFWLPQQPVIPGNQDDDLPLEPYAYGALLGDGCLGGRRMSFAGQDYFILDRVGAAVTALGTTYRQDARTGHCPELLFRQNGKLRTILDDLDACRSASTKSVHPRYLAARESARRELLAGLLDTDGSIVGPVLSFASCSPRLAADTAWLARSLGAVVTEFDAQASYSKGIDGLRITCRDMYRIHVRFPVDGPNPFRLPRKAKIWSRSARSARTRARLPLRAFRSIEPAGTADTCCIELDTDDDLARVYLTDTALIPTHNTGKTAETLIGLEWRRRLGHRVFPLVVITPAWAVCDVWAREIARWLPGWKSPVMHGGPDRLSRLGTADTYLTTYATARIDANDASGPLCRLNPAAVTGDEAHLAKGSRLTTEKGNSTVSAAFRRIASRAGTVVGLTGTPVTLNTGDIFTILAATDPDSWPSRERFTRRYCETQQGEYEEKITGMKTLAAPEFFAAMTGTMRRVTKKQVLPWLPDKIYSVRRVRMPEAWRKAYDGLRDDMLAELPDGGELNVMDVIAQVTFLGQLASAAADVEITEGPEEDPYTGQLKKHYHAVLKRPSWKCDEMLEILAERPGQPVVVFAPSRQLAMIAGAMAAEEGRRVGYIVGLGGGVTARSRQADIAAFTAGKLDLIATTTGAGGTGIDGLQVAGTAVFLQRPRSLGTSVQGEDRLHRIGSEIHARGVEIIDIIAEDTVDEIIREQIVAKGGMAAELFRDPGYVRELLGGLK